MKNLTIRRMAERGEQLYCAARDEARWISHTWGTFILWRSRIWRQGKPLHLPALARYVRYIGYRRNLKRLGIG